MPTLHLKICVSIDLEELVGLKVQYLQCHFLYLLMIPLNLLYLRYLRLYKKRGWHLDYLWISENISVYTKPIELMIALACNANQVEFVSYG
jgi:hypothetical protein